jgi:hypothetical protein
MRFRPLYAIGFFLLALKPALAEGIDPRDLCYKQLTQGTDMDKLMMAAWTMGYLAAAQENVIPVDIANATTILRNLADVCAANSQLSLIEVVSMSRKSGVDGPGGEAEARALLERFLAPGADLGAMTMALKPSEADIRAVYNEPLAGKLVAMYEGMYQPGAAIGPGEGQDSLILVRTMTDHLIRGDAVLGEFPGGYRDVAGLMNPGFAIVRFKFVKAGEEAGMAFDGLIHVNGRWVLMPKPWRAME